MRLKLLAIATLLVALALPMQAGVNDWYLWLSPGYYLNPLQRHGLGGVSVGLEKQISRANTAGLSVYTRDRDLYTAGNFDTAEYGLTGYWKPTLALWKNQDLYLSLGGNLGTGQSGVTFGLNLGLEYAITLYSGIKLFVAQDNLLVFRSDERLVCGLSVGVKIPLSR